MLGFQSNARRFFSNLASSPEEEVANQISASVNAHKLSIKQLQELSRKGVKLTYTGQKNQFVATGGNIAERDRTQRDRVSSSIFRTKLTRSQSETVSSIMMLNKQANSWGELQHRDLTIIDHDMIRGFADVKRLLHEIELAIRESRRGWRIPGLPPHNRGSGGGDPGKGRNKRKGEGEDIEDKEERQGSRIRRIIEGVGGALGPEAMAVITAYEIANTVSGGKLARSTDRLIGKLVNDFPGSMAEASQSIDKATSAIGGALSTLDTSVGNFTSNIGKYIKGIPAIPYGTSGASASANLPPVPNSILGTPTNLAFPPGSGINVPSNAAVLPPLTNPTLGSPNNPAFPMGGGINLPPDAVPLPPLPSNTILNTPNTALTWGKAFSTPPPQVITPGTPSTKGTSIPLDRQKAAMQLEEAVGKYARQNNIKSLSLPERIAIIKTFIAKLSGNNKTYWQQVLNDYSTMFPGLDIYNIYGGHYKASAFHSFAGSGFNPADIIAAADIISVPGVGTPTAHSIAPVVGQAIEHPIKTAEKAADTIKATLEGFKQAILNNMLNTSIMGVTGSQVFKMFGNVRLGRTIGHPFAMPSRKLMRKIRNGTATRADLAGQTGTYGGKDSGYSPLELYKNLLNFGFGSDKAADQIMGIGDGGENTDGGSSGNNNSSASFPPAKNVVGGDINTGNLPTNMSAIATELAKLGWDKPHIAAILGRMRVESPSGLRTSNIKTPGDVDPTQVNSIGMTGSLQWDKARRARLKAFAASRGGNWLDPKIQADFTDYEYKTTEKRAGDAFFAANTPAAMERAIGMSERAGVDEPTAEARAVNNYGNIINRLGTPTAIANASGDGISNWLIPSAEAATSQDKNIPVTVGNKIVNMSQGEYNAYTSNMGTLPNMPSKYIFGSHPGSVAQPINNYGTPPPGGSRGYYDRAHHQYLPEIPPGYQPPAPVLPSTYAPFYPESNIINPLTVGGDFTNNMGINDQSNVSPFFSPQGMMDSGINLNNIPNDTFNPNLYGGMKSGLSSPSRGNDVSLPLRIGTPVALPEVPNYSLDTPGRDDSDKRTMAHKHPSLSSIPAFDDEFHLLMINKFLLN